MQQGKNSYNNNYKNVISNMKSGAPNVNMGQNFGYINNNNMSMNLSQGNNFPNKNLKNQNQNGQTGNNNKKFNNKGNFNNNPLSCIRLYDQKNKERNGLDEAHNRINLENVRKKFIYKFYLFFICFKNVTYFFLDIKKKR